MLQPTSLGTLSSLGDKPSPIANAAKRDVSGYISPLFSLLWTSARCNPFREVPCLLEPLVMTSHSSTRVVTQCVSLSHIFPCDSHISPSLHRCHHSRLASHKYMSHALLSTAAGLSPPLPQIMTRGSSGENKIKRLFRRQYW